MSRNRHVEGMLRRWEMEVYKDREKVDPNKQESWESMAYGFFLALTRDVKRARSLAQQAYNKNLI